MIILFNCIVFSLLFFYIFQNDEIIIETFIEPMDEKMNIEPDSEKLKSLKKEVMDIMESDESENAKLEKVMKSINHTKKNLTTKEEKEELKKHIEYIQDLNKPITEKLSSGMNAGPTENILSLNDLSKENFTTLKKVCKTMSTKDIESMFKLNNDQFVEMLNEITKSNK